MDEKAAEAKEREQEAGVREMGDQSLTAPGQGLERSPERKVEAVGVMVGSAERPALGRKAWLKGDGHHSGLGTVFPEATYTPS